MFKQNSSENRGHTVHKSFSELSWLVKTLKRGGEKQREKRLRFEVSEEEEEEKWSEGE